MAAAQSDKENHHDAVLRVFDATDRLGKNLIGWKWEDGSPTISLDENQEAERLIQKAEEKIAAKDLAHGTVVAQVWMEGETVSQVEWDDRYIAADKST